MTTTQAATKCSTNAVAYGLANNAGAYEVANNKFAYAVANYARAYESPTTDAYRAVSNAVAYGVHWAAVSPTTQVSAGVAHNACAYGAAYNAVAYRVAYVTAKP